MRAEERGQAVKISFERVCVTAVGLTSQSTTQNAWIVDSGASQHITNRKDWLSDFSECDGDVLTIKGSAKVKGRGKVKFSDENGGYTLILSNVLYVPGFSYNLLSVHCLAKKNVSTEVQEKFAFGRDIWNDNVIMFNVIGATLVE